MSSNPVRIVPPAQQPTGLRLLSTVIKNPLQAWPAALYTEPLFRWRAFGRDVLFVMAPELIREVLVEHADAFGRGEIMLRALKPALGDAILTADGERWRWQRRAAAPSFRAETVLGFVPKMAAAAEQTRQRWLALGDGAKINMMQEMMRTTFDIIVETALSGQAAIDVERTEREITDYLASVGWVTALAMLRAPLWMPYPGSRRARRAQRYLKGILAGLAAADHAGRNRDDDLLSLLAGAHDPETGQAMNDRDLTDNLLTFITAGHETTALALTWTFYLLSLHPQVEQRVLDEIYAVAGDGTIRKGHVDALVYTRQVVSESLRLYPPAPLVLRSAARDVQIGGNLVRQGDAVYVPIYAVHRHTSLWQAPDAFDPERFSPAAVKMRDRYAYLPFGAGPRICIGMVFALTEATVILATLLRSVRLRLRPGYAPTPSLRVTLRPAGGMPMQLRPR